LLSAVVALGCAFSSKDAEAQPGERQPVYVDDIQAPASVKAGATVEVTVNGNLPTPAWEIENVEVKKDDHTVTIVLWGRLTTSNPGIQVLQPFTRKVPVPGLSPGTWVIEVLGFGDTGDRVQVQVH
jgi:hypothetical protein